MATKTYNVTHPYAHPISGKTMFVTTNLVTSEKEYEDVSNLGVDIIQRIGYTINNDLDRSIESKIYETIKLYAKSNNKVEYDVNVDDNIMGSFVNPIIDFVKNCEYEKVILVSDIQICNILKTIFELTYKVTDCRNNSFGPGVVLNHNYDIEMNFMSMEKKEEITKTLSLCVEYSDMKDKTDCLIYDDIDKKHCQYIKFNAPEDIVDVIYNLRFQH